ncbi:MAG: hypothetical protein ABSA12_14660 [Verrucomicrobiia bacterium]|jgi:hypothetical protein
MKRILPWLAILLVASVLGVGCATSSGGGHQPVGTSANSGSNQTPPPAEVHTPTVGVPPSNP